MDIRLRNMTSVYFVNDTGMLCLYRIGSRVANNLYIGSAGGHFEPDELNDPRACVLREMKEELGLTEEDIHGLTLRYVTMRLKNGELRQNYYYFARLTTDRPLHSTEGILEWVSYEKLPYLEMPASAKLMMLHYLEEGRYTDKVYGAVTSAQVTRFVPLEEFEDDAQLAVRFGTGMEER